MAREDRTHGAPSLTDTADISLIGRVDEAMACKLRDALSQAEPGGDSLVIEMTTLGGDPEMARRMICDLDAARKRLRPRRLVFLGKSVVYSAGATFMAGLPREDRYLARDTVLLIHCRQLDDTIEIQGPLRASKPKVEALLHQLECGIMLEEANFERLIDGSTVTMDELLEKALYNWYLYADQALEKGLIAGIAR